MIQAAFSSLAGSFLLAMPGIGDARFERVVIVLCQHTLQGAMGLVLNRPFGKLDRAHLYKQLEIECLPDQQTGGVVAGGPVETSRGFVLHSLDYSLPATLTIAPDVGLTATLDVLRDMAAGKGPRKSLIALGYVGWGAGQLEQEMTQHGWLTAPLSPAILFDTPMDQRWENAMGSLGIDARMLYAEPGHA